MNDQSDYQIINDVRVPDRVAADPWLTDILKYPYRRHFRNASGGLGSMGSSRPIPDDDINLVRNHLDKGDVELTESEYFAEQNNSLIEQEKMLAEARARSQAQYGLTPLLLKEKLHPRTDLPKALQQSAFQIIRARECLDAVYAEMRAYEKTNPASLSITETDSDGESVRRVHIRPTDYRLTSLIGDLTVHCREALDYISWGLIDRSVRNPEGISVKERLNKSVGSVQFPIVSKNPSEANLTSKERRRRVERIDKNTGRKIRVDGIDHRIIDPAAEQMLLSCQPYRGWNGNNTHPLVRLSAIVNGHKHRELTLTERTVHGYLTQVQGLAALGISTIRAEHESIFDMGPIESLFSNHPEGMPDDVNVYFQGAIDITIQDALFSVDRIFHGGQGAEGGMEPFPRESGMECCLHDIVRWVENKWVEFEQCPHLFTDADAR